jgi:hypothetical protein
MLKTFIPGFDIFGWYLQNFLWVKALELSTRLLSGMGLYDWNSVW